jgi:hypothetical protein
MFRYKAHWYVYELIDPRNGEVFYVGKGKGNRICQHESEARSGYQSYKCNKIRSIWQDGHQIIRQKVAEFWNENAAYECEKDRIDEIGFEQLTNLMRGGRRKPNEFANAKRITKPRQIVRKEIRMEIAWNLVEQYLEWFVLWLVRPTPNAKMVVESLPKGIQRVALESFVNVIVPVVWKRLIKEPQNHNRLQELFRPCNIQLEFEPKVV